MSFEIPGIRPDDDDIVNNIYSDDFDHLFHNDSLRDDYVGQIGSGFLDDPYDSSFDSDETYF
jgi:hypothetical protein